ncbi:MAG TPA: glycosyltransferase [Lacipirellula sp.]
MRKHIVFIGSRAQRPGRGGQMWVFLQYLLGFRKLGYEVLYVDALPPESCVDRQGNSCRAAESWNVEYLTASMKQYGLENNWTLLSEGHDSFGVPRREMLRRVREAECVINVMGFLRDPDVFDAAQRLVFLDIDPGFGQMWRQLQLADIFAAHDCFLTVGLNVGGESSLVPTCGLNWTATPPPVALDYWPAQPPRPGLPFTSVCTWRGIFGPIEYQGRTWGLRVHEFRKFMELPLATGGAFQLALDVDARDARDLRALNSNGWQLVDPRDAVQSPHDYQRYIQRSGAEFGVAKQMYVDTRGGWISDRTVCYLASGKPALVQDTGIRDKLPTGEGLLVFTTMEEAVEGVERIRRDYALHARAARRIAEEYFDSDKVLDRLLQNIAA